MLKSFGATVYINVNKELHYDFLHKLEYHPEIHIISYVYFNSTNKFIYSLRSDTFPSDWDRKSVDAIVSGNDIEWKLYEQTVDNDCDTMS